MLPYASWQPGYTEYTNLEMYYLSICQHGLNELTHPPTAYQESPLLHIHTHMWIVRLFHVANLIGIKYYLFCGFHQNFPGYQQCFLISSVCFLPSDCSLLPQWFFEVFHLLVLWSFATSQGLLFPFPVSVPIFQPIFSLSSVRHCSALYSKSFSSVNGFPLLCQDPTCTLCFIK